MTYYKNMGLMLILAAALGVSCGKAPDFTAVQDKEWKLTAVRTRPENISLDRNQLASEDFTGIFTIRFSAGQVNGKGVSNRYFGPYEAGADQAISIKNVAATLMASIREPEKLKEREFFNYVGNIYRWNINKGNLELSTRGEDGAEAVMVFISEE